ncbi:hypothetical protein [Embleya scabrispora]|uniref:hypothetical protein n=1 Tax=Embleya scabrispora TaxID=159449 RepID=UPI000363D1B8|nr:hypothetical protein [Embleya scabrispora]MYS86891.1 hypothetical protein [Streptomyces sp. SID5474]
MNVRDETAWIRAGLDERMADFTEPPAPIESIDRRRRRIRRRRTGVTVTLTSAAVAIAAVCTLALVEHSPKGAATRQGPAAAGTAGASVKPTYTARTLPGGTQAPVPPHGAEVARRTEGAIAVIIETLDPAKAHLRFIAPEYGGDNDGFTHARYDGAWQDGDRTGNLAVTFYSPKLAVGNEPRAGQGPKIPLDNPADLCGTPPDPEALDTNRWNECTPQTLPDGRVISVGRGTSTDPDAVTATVTHPDGSKVSVSMTVHGYGQTTPPTQGTPLTTIPVTQAQLKSLVEDPRIKW